MRHENDVPSEFKCKFYKHLGSPNLTTIAKFDEVVKIGGCAQLSSTGKTAGKHKYRFLMHGIKIESPANLFWMNLIQLGMGLFTKSRSYPTADVGTPQQGANNRVQMGSQQTVSRHDGAPVFQEEFNADIWSMSWIYHLRRHHWENLIIQLVFHKQIWYVGVDVDIFHMIYAQNTTMSVPIFGSTMSSGCQYSSSSSG